MKKKLDSLTQIILLASLVLAVGLVTSCKKAETPPAPKVEK